MTPDQLEREIAEACGFRKIAGLEYSNSDLNTIKSTAKICRQKMREVAEKAFRAGRRKGEADYLVELAPDEKEWLKENNL